jgi:cation transport ATPase
MTEHLSLTLPSLFGDHHTSHVRSILGEITGVEGLVVSSAEHRVSLAYDPAQTSPDRIARALAEKGYRSDEPEVAAGPVPAERATRHTAALMAGGALTFGEAPQPWEGRPLWPCPGLTYSSTMPD